MQEKCLNTHIRFVGFIPYSEDARQNRYNNFVVTTRRQTLKTAAVFCIAVVIFAAFVPAVASSLGSVILTPLWLVISAVTLTVLRRTAVRCDERSVSLLSLILSRAPPAHVALA